MIDKEQNGPTHAANTKRMKQVILPGSDPDMKFPHALPYAGTQPPRASVH